MLDDFEVSLMASTRKHAGSPSKSTPKVRSFLTKDSNTRDFTAWDVDERLIELDTQFKAMKEVMNLSLSDKKAMEEVIGMAKTRGKALKMTAICTRADTLQLTTLSAIAIGLTRRTWPCRLSWTRCDKTCRS